MSDSQYLAVCLKISNYLKNKNKPNVWSQLHLILSADVGDEVTRLSSKRLFNLAVSMPRLYLWETDVFHFFATFSIHSHILQFNVFNIDLVKYSLPFQRR